MRAREDFKTNRGRGLTLGLLFLMGGSLPASRADQGFLRDFQEAAAPSFHEEILLNPRGQTGEALAIARQMVFKNPYHWSAQRFLKNHQPFVFWLQVPTDAVSLLLFLLLVKNLWLFYKKKYRSLRVWGTLALLGVLFSGFYFYHRNFVIYATVVEDQSVFSAPDEEASVFFKAPGGTLVSLRRVQSSFAHIQVSANKGGWVPTLKLLPVSPSHLKSP